MSDSSTHLYSPGLVGIIATESSVSNINGEKGILSYRGYSIEELAQKSTFEETSYLLLFGELPNPDQLKAFTSQVTEYRKLPNELITILKSLPKILNQWMYYKWQYHRWAHSMILKLVLKK